MASSYALTGGTKDVNPQYMAGEVITGGNANTTYSAEIPLPVQRLNNKNRSMVMEILKLQFEIGDDAITSHVHYGISSSKLTQASGVKPTITNPSIIWMERVKYAASQPATLTVDLTDGAGHGILVGADKIYLFYNTATTAATTARVRIWYRWKNVSLTEYIGIVQASQQ